MNRNPPSIAAQPGHRYTLRVYYEDTDAGGIVYHATYLRFAERARTEALRDMGIPHAVLVERFKLMFVVRRIKVDYLRPATLDESLVVLTQPLAVGAASATLRQTVMGTAAPGERAQGATGAEAPRAVLEVGLATVRIDGQRPGRMPAQWRETLQAMLAGGDARTTD
jgi:acyl-CoA thioester hydrolase